MSLADDLKVLTPKIHPMQCSVGELFKHLPDAEVALLKAALNNEAIRHTDICQALRSNGHSISPSTVSRHRNKFCRCEA